MERIQGSPRVASECLSVSLDVSFGIPKGCVPLGIYRVEETNGLMMEWELLGCKMLMAIMRALKVMLCTQCHVTPHRKLHGQI